MQITISAESIKELDEILQRLTVLDPVKTPEPFKNGYDFRKEQTPTKRGRKSVDENAIYRLKKAGRTAKEIAEELGIGYSTVCAKLNKVY